MIEQERREKWGDTPQQLAKVLSQRPAGPMKLDRPQMGNLFGSVSFPGSEALAGLMARVQGLREAWQRLRGRPGDTNVSPGEAETHKQTHVQNWTPDKSSLPSFATQPGEEKQVPGAEGQPQLAVVHGGEKVRSPKAQSDDDARSFAKKIRSAVEGALGDSGTKDACVAASAAIHRVFPNAERWTGQYRGEEGGEHEIVKIGEHFVDVTADQFGGEEVNVGKDLLSESPEYADFERRGEVKTNFRQAEWVEPTSLEDRQRTDKIVAALQEKFGQSDPGKRQEVQSYATFPGQEKEVPGPEGKPQLAVVHGGETVSHPEVGKEYPVDKPQPIPSVSISESSGGQNLPPDKAESSWWPSRIAPTVGQEDPWEEIGEEARGQRLAKGAEKPKPGLSTKVRKALTERYGAKGAAAIFASGQALGWATWPATAAMGMPMYIPLATYMGMLPGIAVAEGLHRLRSRFGKTEGQEGAKTGGSWPSPQELAKKILAEGRGEKSGEGLPSYETRPGEQKTVPGQSGKPSLGIVHGGEMISQPEDVNTRYRHLQGQVSAWIDAPRNVGKAGADLLRDPYYARITQDLTRPLREKVEAFTLSTAENRARYYQHMHERHGQPLPQPTTPPVPQEAVSKGLETEPTGERPATVQGLTVDLPSQRQTRVDSGNDTITEPPIQTSQPIPSVEPFQERGEPVKWNTATWPENRPVPAVQEAGHTLSLPPAVGPAPAAGIPGAGPLAMSDAPAAPPALAESPIVEDQAAIEGRRILKRRAEQRRVQALAAEEAARPKVIQPALPTPQQVTQGRFAPPANLPALRTLSTEQNRSVAVNLPTPQQMTASLMPSSAPGEIPLADFLRQQQERDKARREEQRQEDVILGLEMPTVPKMEGGKLVPGQHIGTNEMRALQQELGYAGAQKAVDELQAQAQPTSFPSRAAAPIAPWTEERTTAIRGGSPPMRGRTRPEQEAEGSGMARREQVWPSAPSAETPFVSPERWEELEQEHKKESGNWPSTKRWLAKEWKESGIFAGEGKSGVNTGAAGDIFGEGNGIESGNGNGGMGAIDLHGIHDLLMRIADGIDKLIEQGKEGDRGDGGFPQRKFRDPVGGQGQSGLERTEIPAQSNPSVTVNFVPNNETKGEEQKKKRPFAHSFNDFLKTLLGG